MSLTCIKTNIFMTGNNIIILDIKKVFNSQENN